MKYLYTLALAALPLLSVAQIDISQLPGGAIPGKVQYRTGNNNRENTEAITVISANNASKDV
jgi:hypothetical protein